MGHIKEKLRVKLKKYNYYLETIFSMPWYNFTLSLRFGAEWHWKHFFLSFKWLTMQYLSIALVPHVEDAVKSSSLPINRLPVAG